MSVLDIHNILIDARLQASMPELVTARVLFMTLPVTVATAETSFSKLKIIKTYLRSTMSQERLDGLAIISIEHECAKDTDFDQVIKEFAMKLAPAHNFSIYEHVTFYENVEVGPPTKSNRGAPNETVTSLVDKPLVCDAWPVQRQTYGYLPSRRVSSSTVIPPELHIRSSPIILCT